MKININNFSKSELKDYVHNNGYFSQAMMNKLERNDIEDMLKTNGVENAVEITNSIPQGDNIFIYNGVVSQRYGKGERNRNGYKISADWWNYNEYMYNPAILLMHDPERWVIGNMVRMRVNEDWLNAMFRVDVNNISDTGIKNQIMTGTLKATSTGSLVEEYWYEDMDWNTMSEEKAEEKYGEWELFLAHYGMSDKLILNITKSTLLEVSMVTLWSNYKAVHSDTMSNYFINKLSNKMWLTKEQLQDKLNAVDTTEKEVETPEGIEAETTTDEVVVSENDTQEEATEETTETTDEVEEVTDVVEDETQWGYAGATETVEAKEEEKPEATDELQDALKKIDELNNKIKELEDQVNTPVVNNKLWKGGEVQNEVSEDQKMKNYFSNVVRNQKV